MAEPALEPNTAPRDLEALKNVPPFKLRLLATKLGAFLTPELQQAWHQLTNKEAQADYVLKLLKEFDAKQGTNGVNGAAHPAPSAVVPVSPAATALVQSAAVAEKPKPKRNPVPQPNPAVPTGPANGASVDLGAAVLERLDELAKAIHTLNHSVAALTQHVTARDGKTSDAFQSLAESVAKLTSLQTWTLTTLLTVGENQLGAPSLDILRSAVSDAAVLDQLVAQVQEELGSGK